MEKFCCVRLNLSGGFRGVVGVVSFSVDFNIRSDPVVIGLTGLESFAVGIDVYKRQACSLLVSFTS